MRVVLFGATGMVGQGVLRECLLATDVEGVATVGRTPTGRRHEKLREITHADFSDFSPLESQLKGFDAAFYCVGVSAFRLSEADYTRFNFDHTLAAAKALAHGNPEMIFVYVSGVGTDSTEQGRSMWARVKGRTENALLRLPFKAAYMFRPGGIQPMHGETSKTRSYRVLYAIGKPILPLARALFPGSVMTTEEVGRAMLNAARGLATKSILEPKDIIELAGRTPSS